MCLQEVRLYPFKNSPAFNYVHKTRTTKTNGGGICIGIDTKINYRTLDYLIPPEIEALDCEIQLVQVFHSQFQFIIINCYVPNQNTFRKQSRATLNKWLMSLITKHNQDRFLICGDFNSPVPLLPHLYCLNQDSETTFKRRSAKESKLDFIFASFPCKYKHVATMFEGVSDHKVIEARITIPNQNNKGQLKLKIPSKNLSLDLCCLAENAAEEQKEHIVKALTVLRKVYPPYNTIRMTLR
jgi:hypothetical protein